jgi:hypothetical protein
LNRPAPPNPIQARVSGHAGAVQPTIRHRPHLTIRLGADSNQLAKIREWARANGHQVSDRGRISIAVQEAYHAAN